MTELRRHGSLHESFDRFSLESDKMSVSQCRFDFALTILILDGRETAEVRIGSEFELAVDDSEPIWMSPEGPPDQMAPALALLRRRVVRLDAFKTGELEIEFDAGRIRVPSGRDFEAWTLNTEDGCRLVSIPGGDLATWLPEA